MANFFVTLTEDEIARQISNLLNSHNKLISKKGISNIKTGTTDYFVELNGDKVIGCAGIEIIGPAKFVIKHVCVDPKFRNRGIGKKVITSIINSRAFGEFIMTIRASNTPSLAIAKALGFRKINFYRGYEENIIVVRRSK